MSGRSRQKLGVLLLVLLAAFVASSCGGGGEETPSTTAGGIVPTTAPAGGPAAPGEELIGTAIATTRDTPAEFTEVYGQKPIVLLFYDMRLKKQM